MSPAKSPLAFGLALLMTLPALAGCLTEAEPLGSQGIPGDEPVRSLLKLLPSGGFEIDVPVDVVLVGFEPGTAAALQDRLPPEKVAHASLDFYKSIPPNTEKPTDPTLPLLSVGIHALPVIPTAHFRVREAPVELVAELDAFMATAKVADAAGDIYDANRVEDFLAEALPRHGHAIDPNRPMLVFLHGRDALPEGHAYRYTFSHGYLEPVRVFGERHPLVVMDVSARTDPYVVREPFFLYKTLLNAKPRGNPYDFPLDASGDATVKALAQAVVDATHFRLLQGAIYPIATKPCHALTLILAVRTASVSDKVPGYGTPEAHLDAEMLKRAFENATGEGTWRVDTKVLKLPVDDPVLDAVSRGSLGTLDAFRAWLDANWQKYWVAHEGCEPYVSFLLWGDAADPLTFGIGMYDVKKSHRISFSSVDELMRLRDGYTGPGKEEVGARDKSRFAYNWVNKLYAHETGHLIGQRHPHDVTFEDRGRNVNSWSSVWTTMSYQDADRNLDFGKVDRANFMRNRAGFAVQEAMLLGLDTTPEFAAALAHLERFEWQEAGEVLGPLVQAAMRANE